MNPTHVRSPMGVVYVEGGHDWALAPAEGPDFVHGELAFLHLTTDLLSGYEMGFAAATRDPWDGRCKLEPLMVEADP